MGWLEDQLNDLKSNAQREFQAGVQDLSNIVRTGNASGLPTADVTAALSAQQQLEKIMPVMLVVGAVVVFVMMMRK